MNSLISLSAIKSYAFLFSILLLSGGKIKAQTAASNNYVSPVSRHGQLRVEGNRVVNAKGEPAQLIGMSLFWSQWQGKYYTPETISWLAQDWKCTVVRAAMGIEHDGYLQYPEKEKSKMITAIDAAIANGIYVIIDWHDHHGENHLKEAKAFFAEMAQRYGDKPNVIYEPYNEPLKVSWSKVLKPYFQEIIDTIRHYDPDNIIVCGTPNWSQDVEDAAADPLTDKHVAYTLHFYASTHKDKLRAKARKALKKNIALMVTEFGTTEATGDGYVNESEMKTWWNFMDEFSISWCNWSVADKKENASILIHGTPISGWTIDQLTYSGKMIKNELLKRSKE